ncbi:hypothetical protein PIB30_073337 [Stylosanthes scabra]|uniref:Retrotransposon gag domain-containing protein n=1 Tax=Stylosanthes scabra TaxID=79078 RepID=A0ABU6VN01_9FABA|nr:hypothetical protein [Stylosanthes scabra]
MQSLYHTLKKDALTWFNSLPPNSIECFSDLADNFMKNFTTRWRFPKTCLNLYSIVQKPEKPSGEEGQTAVKTDRNKKDNPQKEHFREDRGRREHKPSRSYYNLLSVSLTQFLNEVSQVEELPAPRPIKNTHRGD